jgi:hypothetical protein
MALGRPISTGPTWSKLSEALGYSRTSFVEWRKLPGAPLTPDREAWRRFIKAGGHGLKAMDTNSPCYHRAQYRAMLNDDLLEAERLLLAARVRTRKLAGDAAGDEVDRLQRRLGLPYFEEFWDLLEEHDLSDLSPEEDEPDAPDANLQD